MNLALILVLVLVGFAACESGKPQLILATTTSVEESGLLDALIPAFEDAQSGHSVKVMPVGSGQAFELGRRKDADLLITHAPFEEVQFVHEGHGEERVAFMYNHFDIVGPAEDPAGVRTAADAPEAFRRIAERRAPFVSRGDSSGTHLRELAMWEASGAPPETGAAWYTQAGGGMADVMRIASQRKAYTLADRATFKVLGRSELTVLFDGSKDDQMFNPYALIVVTGARNAAGAAAFVKWMKGDEAQGIIARFGVDRFGGPLFVPYLEPQVRH